MSPKYHVDDAVKGKAVKAVKAVMGLTWLSVADRT